VGVRELCDGDREFSLPLGRDIALTQNGVARTTMWDAQNLHGATVAQVIDRFGVIRIGRRWIDPHHVLGGG
jgi:hypothetical protein